MDKNYHFGLSFLDLLATAFIILKLLGKITWSWVWVLSPIWIPLCIVLPLLLIWIFIRDKI